MSSRKITIFGSGLIGRSWAMLYAAADFRVTLYDLDRKQIDSALLDIEQQLIEYEKKEILKGSRNAAEQFRLIDGCDDLKMAIENALLIQECVPENLPLKQDVFRQIDELMTDETIVASSTSTFLPSRFAANLKHKRNVLVAHPVCPPYLIPLVEIVPSPFTDAHVTQTVKELMLKIGQEPVVLTKEIDGFALNRLQYAILNEAWDMVSKGVLTVAEIDTVMSEGLGLRYAFAGPFMTAHLNANGMKDYCDRYANSIFDVSCTMQQTAKKWQEPEISQISAALNEIAPVSTLPERRQDRSECLFHLFKLKKSLNQSNQ